MSDCNHQMERHQHWDECSLCGARWTPSDGFNVPMNSRQNLDCFAELVSNYDMPDRLKGIPYRIVKRHKRLWIDDDNGNPIYTPPDFIHIQGRQSLKELAEALRTRPYIEAVMEFEARLRPARTSRRKSS